MRMTARAQLEVVEAAYRVEVSDAQWLEGVARACQPLLDRGFGLCAFEFEHRPSGPPKILAARMLGMPEGLAETYPRVFHSMGADVQMRPFAHGPCTTGSRMMGAGRDFEQNPLMQRYAQTFGIYDSMWVTAAEPSGWGCGLHAGRPEIVSLGRSDVARWARIASHLAAAVRLRRRLARPHRDDRPVLAPVQAIFRPDGRVEEARGETRQPTVLERLRATIREVEQIRSRQARRGGPASLQRWPGLVDARWSLVDQFESDGRRYIVARDNPPEPPGAAALTLRERQVVAYAALGHDNKVIAYDLGIAHSTVRVLMARAAAKFGVQHRSELIAAYEASVRGSSPSREEASPEAMR